MHLFGAAGFPEHFHDLLAGCAPDNRVVYNDDSFPFYEFLYRVQLDLYPEMPDILLRFNKGPSNIMVSYQAEIKGDAAFFGKAQGSRDPGIRDWNDKISVYQRILWRVVCRIPF